MARSLSPDHKRSRHHSERERASGRDDRRESSREHRHDKHRDEKHVIPRSEEKRRVSSPDHRSRQTSSGARSDDRRPRSARRRSPEREGRRHGREEDGEPDLRPEPKRARGEPGAHDSGDEVMPKARSGRKEDAEGEARRGSGDRRSDGLADEEEPTKALVPVGTDDAEGGGTDLSSMAAMEAAQSALEAKEKAKAQPSFGLSGKLAEETNKVRGITLLFTEPPEARQPSMRWRLYVFKDGESFGDPLYIHRQTCYLFGRERKIADVPTDHPSCSKQHAVLQYRLTEKENKDFIMKSVVVPYIMDLGSTNGTYLNGQRIEAQRYYELLEKDTIKFGNSSREYVLLHEGSTN